MSRVRKAIKKTKRLIPLVRVNKKAVKLVKTGIVPTWSYGVEAFGLSEAPIKALRAATAAVASPGGTQGCPVAAIRATLGEDADPLCIATKASVLWWAGHYASNPASQRMYDQVLNQGFFQLP